MTSLLKGPILIIDNDETVTDAFELLFKKLSVKVVSFNSASQALAAFRKMVKDSNAPQVVLIDATLMGDLDGFDVAREMTEIDTHDDSLKIIITDKQVPFTKMLSANCGAEAVLAKSQVTGIGLLNETEFLLRKRRDRQVSKKNAAPGGKFMIAVIFGTLLAGLSAIGAYDWHCNEILKSNQKVAQDKDTEMIKALFAQQQVNDKTRQDDKYAELERRLHDAESSLNGVWIDRGNMWRALDKAGIKLPKKDGK